MHNVASEYCNYCSHRWVLIRITNKRSFSFRKILQIKMETVSWQQIDIFLGVNCLDKCQTRRWLWVPSLGRFWQIYDMAFALIYYLFCHMHLTQGENVNLKALQNRLLRQRLVAFWQAEGISWETQIPQRKVTLWHPPLKARQEKATSGGQWK